MGIALLSRTNKRTLLIGLLLLVVAGSFWGGSRYPSLSGKALMGGATLLEDPLSFEIEINHHPSDTVLETILYTTYNWGHTNLRGMIFGLLLGAGFLTLLNHLRHRGHKGSMMNTLIGVATGAPLGVCVNCAAPVAKAMHDGGARLETTLSTMFSSPTLNIVVLTMLFSIFPFYMAAIKLGLTFMFLLIGIPLLTRYVFKNERAPTYDDSACEISLKAEIPVDESWLAALWAVVMIWLKNLWYVVSRTVPLMALAGLLGAALATLLPIENLQSLETSFAAILLVAMIGIFLPVPVAFDVVVAGGLLAKGFPAIYVMVLLYTLGIFSIYSFFIVWNTISKRVALTLTVVLVLQGIAGGYVASYIHDRDMEQMYQMFDEEPHANRLRAPTQPTAASGSNV